jgi:hypothetical protein
MKYDASVSRFYEIMNEAHEMFDPYKPPEIEEK